MKSANKTEREMFLSCSGKTELCPRGLARPIEARSSAGSPWALPAAWGPGVGRVVPAPASCWALLGPT